jgi:ribosomal protein S27E
MRCGHSIHHRCLSDHSKSSYRCPICSKTITNMESTFRNLDRTIQSQPMPEEFKDTRALVYCNDCGAKSVVEYHWLGLKCDMCESYNTAQLRLLHGDILESPEQDLENRHISASRARSSSHGADEALSQTMAPLRINTNSVRGTSFPQQSLPSSADPSGRFLSYSLTRDRAVSPVISNYFGLPPNRENDDKSISTSLFGSRTQRDTGSDHGGELRIWGTKLKYSYGFLSRETESVDGEEAVESSDASVSEDDEDGEEREEEDDDDDDDDSIDIFGHR